MPTRIIAKRLIVLISLLFMQGQLWALGSLTCLHAGEAAERAAACGVHGQAAGADRNGDAGTGAQCAKCTLTLLLGNASPPVGDVAAVPPAAPASMPQGPAAAWDSVPAERFYRPPIA